MQGNEVDVDKLLGKLWEFFDEASTHEKNLDLMSKMGLDDIYTHDRVERERLGTERAEGIAQAEQNLENDVHRIDGLMRNLAELDSRLSVTDNHYRRTKDKRRGEFVDELDEGYLESADVFNALEHMNDDFAWLTKQLPDFKPGLFDELHGIVSKKRQAVYERLIILLNTAEALREKACQTSASVKNSLVAKIESTYSTSLAALDSETNSAVIKATEQAKQGMDEYTRWLHEMLVDIFTEEVLERFKRAEEAYRESRGGTGSNTSTSDIVTISYINFVIAEYTKSVHVQDCIEEVLGERVSNGVLAIPMAERMEPQPIKVFYAPEQTGACEEVLRSYAYDYSACTEPGTFACFVCDPRRNISSLLPRNLGDDAPDRFFELDENRLYATLDDLCVYERNPHRGSELLKNDLRVDEFPESIRNVLIVLCDCNLGRQGPSTASLLKSLVDIRGDFNVSAVLALTERNGAADFIAYAEAQGKDFCEFINALGRDRREWNFAGSVPYMYRMSVSTPAAPTPQEYARRTEQRTLRLRQTSHTGLFALACIARLVEATDEKAAQAELEQQLRLAASVGSNTPSQADEDPLVIGTVEVGAELFAATPCETPAHECERDSPTGSLNLPIRIPRVGAASTLVAFQQDARGDGFLTNVARAWLMQTPLDQAYVAVLDPYWRGLAVNGMYKLNDVCPDLFGSSIATSDRDCDAKLDYILKLLDERLEADRRAYRNDAPSRPVLLIASNYPDAYTRQDSTAIEDLMRMGERYGISVVLGMSAQNERYAPRGATMVDVDQTGAFTPHGIAEAKCKPLDSDEEELIEILRDESNRRTHTPEENCPTAPIAFDEPDVPQVDGSHGLIVPVGADDTGDIVKLQIGRDFAHMIVTGTTGSGKSVFLHNLIESLCTHYAPSAVDLWLVDFKKVEFSMYTSIEARYPQISLVGIDTSEDFIRAFADHLTRELNRRQDLINTIPIANSISTYNANVPAAERLPRLVAIVDEFHHMSDLMKGDVDVRDQFDQILREGRALGMHVIVADQTVGGLAGLSSTAFSLMGGRVLLKWKDRREVSDMLGLPAGDLDSLGKGEGYLQADSGTRPIRFRGRLVDFGDIPSREEAVRSKLGNPQRPLMSYDSTKRPAFEWETETAGTPELVTLGKAPNFENPFFSIKVRNSRRENLFILDKVQCMGHEIAAKYAWDRWRTAGARTIIIGSIHGNNDTSAWDAIAAHGARVELAMTVESICKTFEQASTLENTTVVFNHFLDCAEDYQELPRRQTKKPENETSSPTNCVQPFDLSPETMAILGDLKMDEFLSEGNDMTQTERTYNQAIWDIRSEVLELLQKGGQRGVHVCFIEETTPSFFKIFGDCGATYTDDIPALFKHRIATQCAREESMVLNMATAASSIRGPERLVKACYCDSDDRITMFIPYQMEG